jgi:Fe/S biogenesis protein NfuA
MTNQEKTVENLITLTSAAEQHFGRLLQQEEQGTNIRIEVVAPGTPRAELNLTFCPADAAEVTDQCMQFSDFFLYVSNSSIPALREASIDFIGDGLQGELSIRAPFLKGMAPGADSTLVELIEYFIMQEINPGLAQHGGMVSLAEVTADNVVLLKFGGGCHGCGMAGVTFKQGIEKALMNAFTEISAVKDITAHNEGDNPYYK